ncbi:MAG: hypothetical protein U5R49_08575 [Deltaproteobacteria bacterium]|nr:hypothetical protein [Deltaproteobacteria bacterium]
MDDVSGETGGGEEEKMAAAMAVRSGFMGCSFVGGSKLKAESSQAELVCQVNLAHSSAEIFRSMISDTSLSISFNWGTEYSELEGTLRR